MVSTTATHRQHIKFSADWDKLKAVRFTTIRSWSGTKERFYREHIGEVFTMLRVPHEFAHPRKGRKIGEATLLAVEKVAPRELPMALVANDVRIGGVPSVRGIDKISAMDEGLLLTFENHTGLMS